MSGIYGTSKYFIEGFFFISIDDSFEWTTTLDYSSFRAILPSFYLSISLRDSDEGIKLNFSSSASGSPRIN